MAIKLRPHAHDWLQSVSRAVLAQAPSCAIIPPRIRLVKRKCFETSGKLNMRKSKEVNVFFTITDF